MPCIKNRNPSWGFSNFRFSRFQSSYFLSHETVFFLYKLWHSGAFQFEFWYQFSYTEKGLSSPVFTIKILAVETFGCYQADKALPCDFSRVNACAAMPSVKMWPSRLDKLKKLRIFQTFLPCFVQDYSS